MFTSFLIFVCILNGLSRQLNERLISNEHAFKFIGYFIIA